MRNAHPATELLHHTMKPFQRWLEDPAIEDILMQNPNEVVVQGGGKTTEHEIDFDFVQQQGLAILAGSLKGQNISRSRPLLSADIPGGLRLQAVLPPCVNDGTVALAIRRSKESAPTITDVGDGGIFAGTQPIRQGISREDEGLVRLYYAACEAVDPDTRRNTWTAFFQATMKAEKTHILCGKVGSGKTYASMALAQEIPLSDRICTIQDADEWKALPHRNRVDLFYSKGDQGASRVTPNDLVEASLRMAMKWLFLQELRGAEAFSFMRARRSGHPGLTTCHADNARAAFSTLAMMVSQHERASNSEIGTIETALKDLIDVVVHFHRPEGRFEISEVWFAPAERLKGTLS
jgi:type IV secretion system protein VirB11